MKKLIKIIFVLIVGVFLASGSAWATLYGFDNITNNNATNASVGEAQLTMDVTQSGLNILFMFLNSGPAASSITDIYFDDDVPLLSFAGFQSSAGVSFDQGAAPPNLPGGQEPLYHFSSNYAYDSNSPAQPNGVNPGEYLGILFAYINADFQGIINALANQSLRVGIHVQGFADGGSESFINGPPPNTPVPEPATMLMIGTGLIGLAGISRKRLKK